MKEYLTSDERNHFTRCAALVDAIDIMATNKHISKEEAKYYKTAKSFLMKANTSVINSLNNTALKTLLNYMEDTTVSVVSNFSYKLLQERKESDATKGYEASKTYYDLVEVAMESSCKNCTKCAKDCSLYHHLEEQGIIDGGYKINNCKYSY